MKTGRRGFLGAIAALAGAAALAPKAEAAPIKPQGIGMTAHRKAVEQGLTPPSGCGITATSGALVTRRTSCDADMEASYSNAAGDTLTVGGGGIFISPLPDGVKIANNTVRPLTVTGTTRFEGAMEASYAGKTLYLQPGTYDSNGISARMYREGYTSLVGAGEGQTIITGNTLIEAQSVRDITMNGRYPGDTDLSRQCVTCGWRTPWLNRLLTREEMAAEIMEFRHHNVEAHGGVNQPTEGQWRRHTDA